MAKVQWNISARTSHLLGKENVANADSALIELVKNCYDADARNAIIIFDIKYDDIPYRISNTEYQELIREDSILISELYEFSSEQDDYYLKALENKAQKSNSTSINNSYDEDIRVSLWAVFNRYNRIIVIDNGCGMTLHTLETKWMTIGTSDKVENMISRKNRIKVGSKGIGRFALDRLGSLTELFTYSHQDKQLYRWFMNWDAINDINANITSLYAEIDESDIDLKSAVNSYLDKYDYSIKPFSTGTILQISGLRDKWSGKSIKNLATSLGTLIPPEVEDSEDKFNIYLFSKHLNDFEILPYNCDDFDYQVIATYNAKGTDPYSIEPEIEFKMIRKEFDVERLDEYKEIFDYPELSTKPQFLIESFKEEFYHTTLRLSRLFHSDKLDFELFRSLGNFKFVYFFMKNTDTKSDRDKFYHYPIKSHERKHWFKNYGGIKIYRDRFKIRPYGEPEGSSFDWLGLGARAAKSPAAPSSSKSGKWQVRPNQISGYVQLSKSENRYIDDKSSREGFIENEHTDALKRVIIKIIEIFENDRQTLSVALDKLFYKNNLGEEIRRKASKLIRGGGTTDNERNIINAYRQLESEYDSVLRQNSILRGLSSSSLVMATMAHELKSISDKMGNIEKLKKNLARNIPDNLLGLSNYKNPLVIVQDLESNIKSMKHWVEFSLLQLKKDRRLRKSQDLYLYFDDLKRSWGYILAGRGIQLVTPINTSKHRGIRKRCFTIDLDSVFNNLIINSIYAFDIDEDQDYDRVISIDMEVGQQGSVIELVYKDNGPGLSNSIDDTDRIFEYEFSTKHDKRGNQTGTGLGLWILKSIIDDYKGTLQIDQANNGFSLKLNLPISPKQEGWYV